MFLFQGYRCPGSGRGDAKCSGKNERKPTLRKRSSDNLSDFLLAFILAGSPFEGVEFAKRDEIDDNRTAMGLVIVPRFIGNRFSASRKGRRLYQFVHEDADARRSRRIQMHRNKVP